MTQTVLSGYACDTRVEGPLSLWRHDMRPLSRIMMADIAARIAEKHGLTVDDLRGVQRAQRYAVPRQEAMWEMMQTGKWSTTRVGMFLGNRDHTTVLWGVKRHKARMLLDRDSVAMWEHGDKISRRSVGQAEAA